MCCRLITNVAALQEVRAGRMVPLPSKAAGQACANPSASAEPCVSVTIPASADDLPRSHPLIVCDLASPPSPPPPLWPANGLNLHPYPICDHPPPAVAKPAVAAKAAAAGSPHAAAAERADCHQPGRAEEGLQAGRAADVRAAGSRHDKALSSFRAFLARKAALAEAAQAGPADKTEGGDGTSEDAAPAKGPSQGLDQGQAVAPVQGQGNAARRCASAADGSDGGAAGMAGSAQGPSAGLSQGSSPGQGQGQGQRVSSGGASAGRRGCSGPVSLRADPRPGTLLLVQATDGSDRMRIQWVPRQQGAAEAAALGHRLESDVGATGRGCVWHPPVAFPLCL